MVLEINSRQWLSKIVNNSADLAEVLKQADSICRHCEIITPMICVEQCEIWRAKNEFIEMNVVLSEGDYTHNLLNALKNERRLRIMEALSERPYSIKGLQKHMKNKGYHHSRRTITNNYVKPLMEAELVKKDGGRYKLTLYGQKFHGVLGKFNVENSLPTHSHCYEEVVLVKLKDGPKSYEDLTGLVTRNILSRSLKRLSEEGLITKNQSSDYVFYFRTKKVPKKELSPTEKKVYGAISEVGVSARELSKKAGINLRGTYKYLRELRRKRLVFTRKKPRTYELTPSGMKLANFLEETANLVLDASKASAFLLECSKQIRDPCAHTHRILSKTASTIHL